jgi:hypothetical protein
LADQKVACSLPADEAFDTLHLTYSSEDIEMETSIPLAQRPTFRILSQAVFQNEDLYLEPLVSLSGSAYYCQFTTSNSSVPYFQKLSLLASDTYSCKLP